MIKKTVRIIHIFTGVMPAGRQTVSAMNALVAVNFDAAHSVSEYGYVGAWDGAVRYTAVASYAPVICEDQTSFYIRHNGFLYSNTAISRVWLK